MQLTERRNRSQREKLWVELEWRACQRDFFHFLKYVNVESKRDPRGWEPFELLPYQVEDAKALLEQRYLIFLKARQLGLSTLLMSYAMWLLVTKPGGARVLAIADKGDNADGLIQKLGVQYRLLPEWLRARGPRLTKKGTGHTEWTHSDGAQSFIISQPATETTGASNTVDLVILDEFALVKGPIQDSTYKTIEPTTFAAAQNPSHKGAVLVLCSTARGGHNLFAKTFRAAARGENHFHAVFHPWHVSPFIGPEEYQRQKKFWELKGEPWMLYSEMPETPEQAFSESGARRFATLPPAETVEEFPNRYTYNGSEWVPSADGPLRLRAMPDPAATYCIALDPSGGVGLDYHAAHIGTVNRNGDIEIVGYWHTNKCEQIEAARALDKLGRWFGGKQSAALLVIERQGGWGNSIINELIHHLHYPNMYYHTPDGTRVRRQSNQAGLPVHWTKRGAFVDRLAEWLAASAHPDEGKAGLVGLHPLLYSELQTFVTRPDGKVAADTGCHDDLCMSLVYLTWAMVERRFSAPSTTGEAPVGSELDLRELPRLAERVKRARDRERAETLRWKREMRRAGRRR